MPMPEELEDWLKQATEYVKSAFPKDPPGGEGGGTPPPPPKKDDGGGGDGDPPKPPKKHFWFGQLPD